VGIKEATKQSADRAFTADRAQLVVLANESALVMPRTEPQS
jgi:hypothetical protein